MLKVAPTLIVESVEPSLEFLTTRVGFQKVVAVPGETNGLVFATVASGNVELCLQKRTSVDLPYLTNGGPPSTFLYINVENVDVLWDQLQDCEILTPLEETFDGAKYFFIKEPGGHVLGFSQNA
jgi:uncharacterized glyoxalase superfamily protein PhnB